MRMLYEVLDDLQEKHGWGKPIPVKELIAYAKREHVRNVQKELKAGDGLFFTIKGDVVIPNKSRPLKSVGC